jgi:hypothetical protein
MPADNLLERLEKPTGSTGTSSEDHTEHFDADKLDAAKRIRTMDRRIRRLKAALKPFASISLLRDKDPSGPDRIEAPDLAITPAEIRRARKAGGMKGAFQG